ncbi:hypothetical protein Peur_009824 [Populus x canadensis]
MTSRKEKKITSPKWNFNFRSETEISSRGSSAIRIHLRSERGASQPSSIGRGRDSSPQKVSNLRGHERLPRMPPDEAESTVSFDQMSMATSRQPGDSFCYCLVYIVDAMMFVLG